MPDPSDPDDPVDVDAARRIDALHNRLFLDPIFRGSYPVDLLEDTADLDVAGPALASTSCATATSTSSRRPIDVLGVNYYHGNEVSGHPRTDVVGIGSRPARPGRAVAVRRLRARHLPEPRAAA